MNTNTRGRYILLLDTRGIDNNNRSSINNTIRSRYSISIIISFSKSKNIFSINIVVKTEYTSTREVSRYLILSNSSLPSRNSNLLLLISFNKSSRASRLLIILVSSSNGSNSRSVILGSDLIIRVSNAISYILLNNRYLISRISSNTIIPIKVSELSNSGTALILAIDSNLILQLGNISTSSRNISIIREISSTNIILL